MLQPNCKVNLLQSEDASLRCVGTQTLIQVAKARNPLWPLRTVALEKPGQGVNLEDKFLPLLMDPDTDTCLGSSWLHKCDKNP